MPRWKWFMRRQARLDDPIGPATAYVSRRGAYAPGAAPAEQVGRHPELHLAEQPDWNAPTVMVSNAPLITMGMRQLYGIRQRPAAPS
ncbi:hypothetical protein SAMN05444365_103521 [Micromonospora pattaloongensis]|uniref:Uncharacterized protein n=1 Tax=Micromonospora pattaloongensis TaxID=405436 RepID=A0A1H3MVP3_9ACTN|nr:hypothetical protein [Micromonospora pattaloongensis]SDY80079.1 hypothetical protein SAMN05444365_103521 [Micromonospora pattaloongensis]